MRDAEAVTFAGSRLDRASHLRGDAAAQAALAADPRALGLALWRGRPLLDADAGCASPGARSTTRCSPTPPAPRSSSASPTARPLYAREVPDWDAGPPPAEGFSAQPLVRHPALDGLGFADLRANMAALDAAEAGTAAAAKGILGWHETHRFCANCGAPPSPPTPAGAAPARPAAPSTSRAPTRSSSC